MTIEWLNLAIIGAAAVIIWWSLRTWIISTNKQHEGTNKRLDSLISKMEAFGKALIRYEGRMNNLEQRLNSQEKRLDVYGERIRKLELNGKEKV